MLKKEHNKMLIVMKPLNNRMYNYLMWKDKYIKSHSESKTIFEFYNQLKTILLPNYSETQYSMYDIYLQTITELYCRLINIDCAIFMISGYKNLSDEANKAYAKLNEIKHILRTEYFNMYLSQYNYPVDNQFIADLIKVQGLMGLKEQKTINILEIPFLIQPLLVKFIDTELLFLDIDWDRRLNNTNILNKKHIQKIVQKEKDNLLSAIKPFREHFDLDIQKQKDLLDNQFSIFNKEKIINFPS